MLFCRTGLPEESPRASGRREQDKEHRRATETGEFGETEPAVEPDPKRRSGWIPMVRGIFGNRGLSGDNPSQAEVRNVKPEPEPVGQHPGLEDARGIDRLESRYAHEAIVPSNSVPPFFARGRLYLVANQPAPPPNSFPV